MGNILLQLLEAQTRAEKVLEENKKQESSA